MRTTRTNGGTTYKYVYNGSQLARMTVGGNTLSFIYDATGAPVVVVWNGVPYYYVTTLQGDVLVIMDLAGDIVVSYDYDAWGKILTIGGSMASTLGTLNPLRYRGYVYDQETGLYYLQSRYYNPEWGRFFNADVFISTGQGLLGNNMFAYCNNNPICYADPSGNFPWHIVIGAVVGGGVGVASALIRGESGWAVAGAGLYGAAKGGIIVAYPSSTIFFSTAELLATLLDCVSKGYTFEESLEIMGIAVIGELTLPSTGDILVDLFVDATFGSAKSLSCEAGKTAIGNNSSGKFTINNIATATSSGSGGGGSSGYAFLQSLHTVKGDFLWT